MPAAGLVGFEDFYGSLADGVFHSTQYVRHHAQPLYTPEPDLIHEVVGHGGMLASPRLAELNRLAGEAARRLETKTARDFFSSVFWFSIEFGVVYESDPASQAPRPSCAHTGRGCCAFGEIEEFRSAEIRPLDVAEMGTHEYDITSISRRCMRPMGSNSYSRSSAGSSPSATTTRPRGSGSSAPRAAQRPPAAIAAPSRWSGSRIQGSATGSSLSSARRRCSSSAP